MITRDYHERTVDEALADAETIVSRLRIKRRSEDAEFITGYGVIKTQLIARLTELGLSPSLKLGNEGVVTCFIE